MNEFIGYFLGADKILSVVEENIDFDGLNSPFLKVELERIIDDKPVILSILWHPVLFKESVTEKQSDASALRDSRVVVIRNNILDIMLRYGVTMGEVDYINQRVLTSIQHTTVRANDKLWGQSADDRNLIDIDHVLNNGKN